MLLSVLLFPYMLEAQARWRTEPDGSISWIVKKGEAHTDNIEMSGRFISLITTYGVDEKGRFITLKQLVFPMLRTIPNDTHASLIYTYGAESEPVIKINNRAVNEVVTSFSLKGILTVNSILGNNVILKREIFPSTSRPLAIEKFTIGNTGSREITVDIENFIKSTYSHREKSLYDVYEISASVHGPGIFVIKPGEKRSFAVVYSGRKMSDKPLDVNVDEELSQRNGFVSQAMSELTFSSPDTVISRMFAFAKIRALESIYETKKGLVHGPGGGSYYAAIWANDQAEYANPFFAYAGYPTAIEASMTSWRWFAEYMNPEYKPIPSSIIAEGTSFWNGAGDRGDMAMIAYGASRFALAYGDRKAAEELWPLIEWCIEYCNRKLTNDGVVASDSDELEGRFPAGKANLCTSSLFYDALNSAVYLGRELGKPVKQINAYKSGAVKLKASIEKYFGAGMKGFQTYRYYDGNDLLRSWICIPLTVGIYDRARGTTDALFSPKLWTENGLLTQEGSSTFWDRSTLYGLRGAFAAGERDKAFSFLKFYSGRRLLGDHVPYPVEAWPEGNQRHLSAESALYCRVITEGMFGLRPTGFSSFSITPQLPEGWSNMSLSRIKAFGNRIIDITVAAEKSKIRTEVICDGKKVCSILSENGSKLDVKL